MEERTVERVVDSTIVATCDRCDEADSDKRVVTTYDDEPDTEFYSEMCTPCTREYVKLVDEASIFGDEHTV